MAQKKPLHRKKGDWIAVAKGRSFKARELRPTMRCPMNAAHVITVASLQSHLAVHIS